MTELKKRILITGGAGFIGSHLCKALLQKGHDVTCLDNYISGQKSNILPFLDAPNFKLVEHDVITPFFGDFDQVYHLACPASPKHYQANPVRTIKANVMGSINMLGLAKKTGAQILLASTSEVYGDPEISPQPETYKGSVNPIGIRACYDEGKRCAETLFFDYHREHDVRIKVARIFNTYGPNMAKNDGRVVSNLVLQALENQPITLYGDGSQTRSFCYISDMVRGLMTLMESHDSITGPINLGNEHELPILALAKTIVRLTQSASQMSLKPLPEDDPKQRHPDISLAKKILDWEPVIGLEDGLKQTIAYFKTLD